MPDITIPIPHQGGSVIDNYFFTHYCDLGSKFLHVFYQINPNYVYAYVSNHSDLKASGFSDVNATARAILTPSTPIPAPSGGNTTVRLWRLSDRRALLMLGYSLFVLQVESNDDITLRSATIPNFCKNNVSYGVMLTIPYSYMSGVTLHGSFLMGWPVRENVIWFFNREMYGAGQFGYDIQAVTYNPTTDSLSVKTMVSSTTESTTNNKVYAHPALMTIPGSTKRLFTVRTRAASSGANNFDSLTILKAHLIDSLTDDAIDAPAMVAKPISARMLVPLSETRMLGLIDQRSYFTWENNTWSSTTGIFGATGGSNPIYHCEALDENHFMIFTIASTGEFTTNQSPSLTMRVGRFVDQTFGQTNSSHQSGDGINLTFASYPQMDQPFINKLGTDTFVTYGRGNTSGAGTLQPVIRVLNRPGA